MKPLDAHHNWMQRESSDLQKECIDNASAVRLYDRIFPAFFIHTGHGWRRQVVLYDSQPIASLRTIFRLFRTVPARRRMPILFRNSYPTQFWFRLL